MVAISNKFVSPGMNTPEYHHYEAPWVDIVELQAQIIEVVQDTVTCDVIVDKENFIFETRDFPDKLFKGMTLSNYEKFVIITKSRPGSILIEISFDPAKIDNDIWVAVKKRNDEMWAQLEETFKKMKNGTSFGDTSTTD